MMSTTTIKLFQVLLVAVTLAAAALNAVKQYQFIRPESVPSVVTSESVEVLMTYRLYPQGTLLLDYTDSKVMIQFKDGFVVDRLQIGEYTLQDLVNLPGKEAIEILHPHLSRIFISQHEAHNLIHDKNWRLYSEGETTLLEYKLQVDKSAVLDFLSNHTPTVPEIENGDVPSQSN